MMTACRSSSTSPTCTSDRALPSSCPSSPRCPPPSRRCGRRRAHRAWWRSPATSSTRRPSRSSTPSSASRPSSATCAAPSAPRCRSSSCRATTTGGRAGLIGPHRPDLFRALHAAAPPRTVVHGAATPFLSAMVPDGFHGMPLSVVAYDSSLLRRGLIGAGGVLRQEDLLRAATALRGQPEERPVLVLAPSSPGADPAHRRARNRAARRDLPPLGSAGAPRSRRQRRSRGADDDRARRRHRALDAARARPRRARPPRPQALRDGAAPRAHRRRPRRRPHRLRRAAPGSPRPGARSVRATSRASGRRSTSSRSATTGSTSPPGASATRAPRREA